MQKFKEYNIHTIRTFYNLSYFIPNCSQKSVYIQIISFQFHFNLNFTWTIRSCFAKLKTKLMTVWIRSEINVSQTLTE